VTEERSVRFDRETRDLLHDVLLRRRLAYQPTKKNYDAITTVVERWDAAEETEGKVEAMRTLVAALAIYGENADFEALIEKARSLTTTEAAT
jgi:hypothetical protein